MGTLLSQNHIYGNCQKHIEPCPEFNTGIRNQFGAKPNPKQKFSFIEKQLNSYIITSQTLAIEELSKQ